MAKNRCRTLEKRTKQNRRQVKQIVVLPDDVLLEIFDFYVDVRPWYERETVIDAWQVLVHVCRGWRNLVFQSPRRLNLRLFCIPETRAKDTLDVWPALPVLVAGHMDLTLDMDDVIAALGENNRVCQVDLLCLSGWQLEKVLAAMQVPFPKLTTLCLSSHYRTLPVIPDSFLDGSARSLRHCSLSGILFPGLLKLLLSSTHLVTLSLSDIPHSGYVSPEAMVTLVSVLSSLDTLFIGFQSPLSRPDWQSRSLPPPKRSILPALNKFDFQGVTEYLEELVTRIVTPQLHKMHIMFFDRINLDCPRLARFINCTSTLRALDEARVQFKYGTTSVKLRSRTSPYGLDDLGMSISCEEQDRQLSSIEQVCKASLLLLSTVEDLYIEHHYFFGVWNDGIENTLWLQLLLPFTAVRNLYLFKAFAPGIAAALEEVAGGTTKQVLPRLENILVEGLEASGPFLEKIGRFVAERQLADHPIAISDWDME